MLEYDDFLSGFVVSDVVIGEVIEAVSVVDDDDDDCDACFNKLSHL